MFSWENSSCLVEVLCSLSALLVLIYLGFNLYLSDSLGATILHSYNMTLTLFLNENYFYGQIPNIMLLLQKGYIFIRAYLLFFAHEAGNI